MSNRALNIIEGVVVTLLLASTAVLSVWDAWNGDPSFVVVTPAYRTTVVSHYYL